VIYRNPNLRGWWFRTSLVALTSAIFGAFFANWGNFDKVETVCVALIGFTISIAISVWFPFVITRNTIAIAAAGSSMVIGLPKVLDARPDIANYLGLSVLGLSLAFWTVNQFLYIYRKYWEEE